MSFRVEENGQFRGQVGFLDARLNDGAVENKHVAADAALEATKLEHQHRATYAQESATGAADEAGVIHVVKGTAGTLKTFQVGAVVPNVGAAVVDVDLLKNGVSVLNAPVQLTSGEAAYELVAGVIDTAAVEADDVLEVAVDGTAGGGTLAKGVFAMLDLHEDVD